MSKNSAVFRARWALGLGIVVLVGAAHQPASAAFQATSDTISQAPEPSSLLLLLLGMGSLGLGALGRKLRRQSYR
jgi:hypothetical protein